MANGRLTLCATPIGNLEDISERATRVLAQASVIACEDTRRTRKLLTHLGISAPELVVYNEGNESRRSKDLVGRITSGESIVLVSDAGMPGLSDPGFRLVQACAEAGLDVDVIPGPNAAVTALVLSGLPPGRFVFEGFLPRKPGERRKHIEGLLTEARTIVLYESPHRVEMTLQDLADILGRRKAVLARELTKMHQEVRRGSLDELAAGARTEPVRGEVVIVVQGAVGDARFDVDRAQLARRARELMEAGADRSRALKLVARDAGVPKREVFDALLEEEDAARRTGGDVQRD